MSKCALVMKHGNPPGLGPDENSIPIENERRLNQELPQTLAATKKRLVLIDRKTVVSDQDKFATEHRHAAKDAVEQLCPRIQIRAPLVLFPSRNHAPPDTNLWQP